MNMARLGIAALVAALGAGMLAQQPPAPAAAAKPDTPEIAAKIDQLRKAVGQRWAYAVHFWCEDPRPNRPDDPVIQPTKLFDNLYTIGNTGTAVYVVQTTAGLLMIDALAANQVETQLLPGFKALGLDPANVKVILVGHGHADHFGGATYFQERFGSKVYVSATDWTLMENPPQRGRGPATGGPGGPAGAPAAPAPPIPKRDGILTDGEAVVLGDVRVTPVAVPGHTPGAMGFIFPVKAGGQTHTAALFGGSWLTPNLLSDEAMQTYLQSVAHFREATTRANVDVWLQNHPLMVPFQEWVTTAATRKSGEANPFIVGRSEYQKFLDVMQGCSEVNLVRRRL
jgi:metallo-beta-lactamase class B